MTIMAGGKTERLPHLPACCHRLWGTFCPGARRQFVKTLFHIFPTIGDIFLSLFSLSGPKRSWRCHPKGLLLRKIRNNLRKLPTMDINFISTASNCTQTQLFIKMTRCEGAGVLKQKRKTTQPYVRWTPNLFLVKQSNMKQIATIYGVNSNFHFISSWRKIYLDACVHS